MLPTLIDPITARALLAQEQTITDVASSLVIQCAGDPEFTDQLNLHLENLESAMEVLSAFNPASATDAGYHAHAMRIRLNSLARLDTLTTVKP